MSSPVIRATLANSKHPEYGEATIPFPIPAPQYDAILEMLTAIGIGDSLRRDCLVKELDGDCLVLKCLEQQQVNVDELDYLAKRLSGFDAETMTRFCAVTEHMALHDMTDLINLTFCCWETTVIHDFSDLAEVGKKHLQLLNNGYRPVKELAKAEEVQAAKELIGSGWGIVTSYGVLYENGMVFEPVYDGQIFPSMIEGGKPLTIGFCRPDDPGAEKILVNLPVPDAAVDRVMARLETEERTPVVLEIERCPFQDAIWRFLTENVHTLADGNTAAKALDALPKEQWDKLAAAILFAKPKTVEQFAMLAGQDLLFDFEFLPDVCTAKGCGRYLIQRSGHYAYDETLDEFYDYEKRGRLWMKQHPGIFTSEGYISYEGAMPLEDVLAKADRQQQDPPQPEMTMG